MRTFLIIVAALLVGYFFGFYRGFVDGYAHGLAVSDTPPVAYDNPPVSA